MRVASLLLTGLIACGFAAQAQTSIAPSAPAPRTPQVWLDPALGKLSPIQLQDVAIDIRIEGFVASTTLDLTFFNPNARVLEGELVFPLGSGQTISGYALEVGGKLRQGVVVEKETARVAYEATTRRNIDPGLAELTRGNVFRTRLYPIPANGTKRVAISFDQPLLDAGVQYRYLLPLQFAQKIRHFKVHAEAIRAEHAPKASGDTALTFERSRDSFLADFERNDFQPEHEFAFAIDKPAQPVSAFTVQDTLEPAWRTFAAQLQSTAPAAANAVLPVKRIALFYDASGSARTRDRKRELDFLDASLAKLREVDVDLVAFRNDADPAVHFHVHDGDGAALRKAIEALPLDGGTSYGAVRIEDAPRADVALVFGDGLSNFAGRVPKLSFADGGAPQVLFVHAAQSVDSANLTRWARQYGGAVINLLETANASALAQIGARPWMLQSARVVKGECVDLAPALPAPAAAATSIYGRCKGAAEIELQFGNGGGAPVRRSVRLDDGAALDAERGAFVARLWAAARIADLQNAAQPDDAAITALGKRFGVVTQNTSMLVLDRIEDYVRYRVEPREVELLAQYRSQIAALPKDSGEAQKKQRVLAQVLGWWNEFKQWHNARYPWLETVLVPAAQTEVARWQGVPADKNSAARIASAQKLAEHANALRERWLRDGADAERRVAWEREAGAVMMELDALRQQRLTLAPSSDAIAPAAITPEPQRAQAVAGHVNISPDGLGQVLTERAPAPAAPPPPRPAPSMTVADAAPTPGQALDTIAVTGSNIRRADVETSSPALSIGEERKASGGGAAPEGRGMATRAHIELQEWDPNTPYLALLRAAKEPYAEYLQARERFGTSPSFFLDSADYFRREAKDARLALRVLSNLAEMDTESAPLLRVLAYRLEQWQHFDLAVPLFEDALKLRGEEPQSYRDLGLALARQETPDFARAAQLLWRVVSSEWDSRFPEVQLIALHELNDVLARAPQAERARLIADLEQQGADEHLLDHQPVDLRVVLTWDADNTDIDLWVIDPTGETAIYSKPRTSTGGRVSRDFTGGYGPEVFTIRRPIPGTYTVKANFYGSRQQKVTGDVTVQVEFFTQFDSADNKREAVTRRLENKKDLIEVGRFVVAPK